MMGGCVSELCLCLVCFVCMCGCVFVYVVCCVCCASIFSKGYGDLHTCYTLHRSRVEVKRKSEGGGMVM